VHNFKLKMVFLGVSERVSDKTKKPYNIASFVDSNQEKYNFFINDDDMFTNLKKLPTLKEYDLILSLSSYRELPQIRLFNVDNAY